MDNLPVTYRPYQSKRHSRSPSSMSSPSIQGISRATSPGANSDHLSPYFPTIHAPIPLNVAQATPVFVSDDDVSEKFNGLVVDKGKAVDHDDDHSDAPLSNGHPSLPSSPEDHPVPPVTTPPRANIPGRPSSTFRHIAPRGPSKPATSSPLRPHAPVVTRSFNTAVSLPPPLSNRVDHPRASSSPLAPQKKPDLPAPPTPEKDPPIPSPKPPAPPTSAAVSLPSISPSPAPSSAPSVTTPSSLPHPPTISHAQNHRPTPYRAGFQPKPLYRQRTDSFLSVRNKVSDERKGDDRRLERRLEKLIALHFAPKPSNGSSSRLPRSSSLLDSLRGSAAVEAAEIREAEQKIAPWEPDSSVSACPLCGSAFHPVTNRKHHCRLCGQIICALPPVPKHSNPARRVPCSVLIAADWKTGRVWDVKEGIAYGVTRAGEEKSHTEEKGVRVCRTCRAAVSRMQYVLETSRVPAINRLYDVLMQLEKDILELIPIYQEQLLEIPNPPSPDTVMPAQQTRKQVLDSFTDYDKVASKILNLPCTKGSEEERVQRAIWMRSRAVMQREMGGLPALPKLPATKKHSKSKSQLSLPSEVSTPDPDAELAHRLQPLLEQEALLDQYVQEATTLRKFEDARALKQSLEEIREEIGRLVREANP